MELQRLTMKPDRDGFDPQHPRLSGRPLEVLNLLLAGYDSDDISRLLSITPSTVKQHLAACRRAYQVNSTQQLVIAALGRPETRMQRLGSLSLAVGSTATSAPLPAAKVSAFETEGGKVIVLLVCALQAESADAKAVAASLFQVARILREQLAGRLGETLADLRPILHLPNDVEITDDDCKAIEATGVLVARGIIGDVFTTAFETSSVPCDLAAIISSTVGLLER